MHSFVPTEATLTIEDRMRAFSFWGFQSTAASPLHWKEPGDVVDKDASWAPSRWSILWNVLQRGCRPRTYWRDYISHQAWVTPEKSWKWAGRRRSGHVCLDCWPHNSDMVKQRKMNEWMNGVFDNHCKWSVITASPNANYSAYYMNKLAALFRPW